mmetsp:Transcript_10882/g.34585  ORF Transcript_10882/g.34585 Transcript_10882/m.34585 type:complete len:97 (+) Transcript_10882:614-904(+)
MIRNVSSSCQLAFDVLADYFSTALLPWLPRVYILPELGERDATLRLSLHACCRGPIAVGCTDGQHVGKGYVPGFTFRHIKTVRNDTNHWASLREDG